MQPGEIVWEEPPAEPLDGRKRRGMFADIADELRQHPKRWARIHTAGRSNASTTAHGIRNGTRAGFCGGRWEAIARRLSEGPDADWAVYARYLGDDEEVTP
jgi:hypothetical protein